MAELTPMMKQYLEIKRNNPDSILFFRLEWRLVAFFLLIGLWLAIFITMRRFLRLDEKAGELLLPYLLWVCFAGYLNLSVYLLN